MKRVLQILSYILVAALASVATLALTLLPGSPVAAPANETTKLEELESIIDDYFIGEVDNAAIEDAAAEAMVDALGDRWSYYMSATDYEDYIDQMANAYVGVGITIQVKEGIEGFYVAQVNENGPAYEAGLLPGDVIVGVDGTDVRGMTTTEVAAVVKGEEGTSVVITVLRDGLEQSFTVERRTVMVTVAKGTMLEGNIGLVTIVNFDSRCAEETIAAVEELLDQGATSLIFDVRNNPGGYAKQLVEVLDYLLPEGELFRTVNYAGVVQVDTSDADCLENVPIVVLVNSESYSAAEFFAAALQEYEAGVVVGEKTCGKGYYQVSFELSDGSAVGLSIGEYFTPKGENLAGVGVTPDVEVAVDEETFMAIYAGTLDPMEDPQILAAIEALK